MVVHSEKSIIINYKKKRRVDDMRNEKLEVVREFVNGRVFDKIKATYPRSTQLVLDEEFHQLGVEFPGIMARLHSCSYNRDNRSIEEFAINVATSWVIEDFALTLVNYYTDIRMRLGGTDRDREFQRSRNITTAPDFIIKNYGGEDILVEFIVDNFGYYNKIGKFYLRDWKLDNLIKSSETKQTMIFSLNLKDKTFFLQDVRDMRYRKTERWGKPVNEVDIDFKVYELNKENLIEQFNKLND